MGPGIPMLPGGEFKGEDLVLFRLVGGVAYQVTDHLVFQGGLSMEYTIEPLTGDIVQPFNDMVGDIVIESELRPYGLIGFVGLSYYF